MRHTEFEPVVDLKRVRDLTGQTFGRLTVLSLAGKRPGYRVYWHCRCECGETCAVQMALLTSGRTQSCGCLYRSIAGKQAVTHGRTKTAAYRSWSGMRQRCYYEGHEHYPHYGGRGITVCERWRDSFENFHADMGDPPKGMTIERGDNDGSYSPENCRWASRAEQSINRSTTRYIEHDGRLLPLMQWVKETGVPAQTIYSRIHSGWPEHRLLDPPGTRLKAISDGARRTDPDQR